MTVSYSKQISTTNFCLYSRLLFRWRGSVFKLVWADLLLFLVLYTACSATYRCLLTEPQKRIFEKVALMCESFRNAAPISFILGFYVSIVVTRWWEQYMLIPWPDDMCILISSFIQGQDARCKSLRRGVARYINLAFVLSFTRISHSVSKVFPNYDKLVKAGYLTPKEKDIMETMDEINQHHSVWDPLPLLWASLLVVKARKEGYIPDDHSQEALIHEITNLRYSCSKLQEYSHMSVPLVYTQVSTMATYSYFICGVIGRQFLDPEQGYKEHLLDLYFPFATILQFIFVMGWLKVAESLLNPFGEDDDDFDINELLERNMEISNLIVDDLHTMKPHLLLDLEQEDVPQNHNSQQHNREQNHHFENLCPFSKPADLTRLNTPFNEEMSQPQLPKQEKPFSENYNTISTRTIAIDTHDSSDIGNSQGSLNSIATAIPKTIQKRERSYSFTSCSQSSSTCSYESCFSLVGQNQSPYDSNKTETDVPTGGVLITQRRRKSNSLRASSNEKIDTGFTDISDGLELLPHEC